MKKGLLIIILIISGLNGFSQSRYVDLRARITSPKENDLIREGDDVSFVFHITNQGPDSIILGDSLRYSLSFLYRNTDIRKVPFKMNLAPGDSIQFKDTIHILGGASGDDINVGFFNVPLAFSHNKKNPLMAEFYEDHKNNRGAVSVRYRLLNINKLNKSFEFHLFPNPCATKMLQLHLAQNQVVDLKVISIMGEEQIVRESIRNGDIIDLQSFKSGLYLVQIKDERGTVTSRKLMIP